MAGSHNFFLDIESPNRTTNVRAGSGNSKKGSMLINIWQLVDGERQMIATIRSMSYSVIPSEGEKEKTFLSTHVELNNVSGCEIVRVPGASEVCITSSRDS